jgi:hypothetical protein
MAAAELLNKRFTHPKNGRNETMSDWPNILWYCGDQQRFGTIAALGNPHINTPRTM